MSRLQSHLAFEKLLAKYEFSTVLDIGSGKGEHAAAFLAQGKIVTEIDTGNSPLSLKHPHPERVIVADFNTWQPPKPFDCIWASHVLEHQPDANWFLKRVSAATKEGGLICITVPPLKHAIVGGHVSLWNGGLLIYNLVLAGLDCRRLRLKQYGYCISIILRKKEIALPALAFDSGDINRLSEFFPPGLGEPFNGNIKSISWR